MSANRGRFETRFDEWLRSNNELAVRVLAENTELVRAIAGLFYFEGASDAIRDARAIITDTNEVRNAN